MVGLVALLSNGGGRCSVCFNLAMQLHGSNSLSSVLADRIVQAAQSCLCKVPLYIRVASCLLEGFKMQVDLDSNQI